ncbi:MAG: hypothetical protein E7585_08425 [Ruminococcaceae bacterium]|nr:hypothetical protein [Oscillospiraceae bacterium]
MRTSNPVMRSEKILFGCHRGDRLHYPENTMLAFRAAAELGCDAIETDVRTTKDGHLVLIHDRDVARTTNGSGNVDEMTLEEIRALDAGGWKDPAFAGEKIPTVIEFLEFVSKTDMLINWELKEYPDELGEAQAYGCVDKLVALIDRYGLAERSMMNSFSQKVLEYVDEKWPGKFMIHGYIGYSKKDVSKRPLESFLDWTAIWYKDAEHTAGFLKDYEYAKACDILTCILVKDTEEEYQKAINMGCRMFTSDDPATGIQVLKALGKR